MVLKCKLSSQKLVRDKCQHPNLWSHRLTLSTIKGANWYCLPLKMHLQFTLKRPRGTSCCNSNVISLNSKSQRDRLLDLNIKKEQKVPKGQHVTEVRREQSVLCEERANKIPADIITSRKNPAEQKEHFHSIYIMISTMHLQSPLFAKAAEHIRQSSAQQNSEY